MIMSITRPRPLCPVHLEAPKRQAAHGAVVKGPREAEHGRLDIILMPGKLDGRNVIFDVKCKGYDVIFLTLDFVSVTK